MKKALITISAFILSVMCLTGCGNKELDINAAANTILEKAAFAEQLQPASESIALKRLGIDEADVEVCTAYASTNAVVDELAVIKAVNPENVENSIRAHIQSQSSTYSSYAPNEVSKLDSAVIEVSGNYVIYVVSSDNTSAQSIVNSLIK